MLKMHNDALSVDAGNSDMLVLLDLTATFDRLLCSSIILLRVHASIRGTVVQW